MTTSQSLVLLFALQNLSRMSKMIFLLFAISFLVSCEVVGKTTAIRCDAAREGHIISGNVCSFSCCLEKTLRKMHKRAAIERGKCPAFANWGRPCHERGYTFRHRTVIKYNALGCFICNNGFHRFYTDPANEGSRVDVSQGYTLVRFG